MYNMISFSLANAATLAAAAAFLFGSVVNAAARKSVREQFVRYGFPWWWCWVTAFLEFVTAILLVQQTTFAAGIVLGCCIMVTAIFAVFRARDFHHIVPPAAFLLLLLIAALVQFS